jgi:hypothetical protein
MQGKVITVKLISLSSAAADYYFPSISPNAPDISHLLP